MSSLRTVSVVPAGIDPFARRRTVTNPATGQTVTTPALTGPTTVTVPLGIPGRQGDPGPAGGLQYIDNGNGTFTLMQEIP